MSAFRNLRVFRNVMAAGVLAVVLSACASQHGARPGAASPKQALPPLNPQALPVPSRYTCPADLSFLSPANLATGMCVPYAYLVGGTASHPDSSTACPPGSFMTMGPVECDNQAGIVTPVPPGPDTCSTPGGPCPSSKLPLPPQASVIAWSAITLPVGKCPAGYYFGETSGTATCVPYGYLPGGTPARPDGNTACPAGSAFKPAKLTGTLCTQEAAPYDIVAPVPTVSFPATESHYGTGYERSRLFPGGIASLEFVRSMELLDRLLPQPPARLLDVGGGPRGMRESWRSGLSPRTRCCSSGRNTT